MIHLIDKDELATLRAGERLKEIREGAKLAEKVDKLRELSAEEETNLRKFRDESLKRIQIEIDQKIAERETIRLANEELKKKRIEAEAPLDLVKEWESIRTDRENLSQEKKDLRAREIKVEIDTREVRELGTSIEEEKRKLVEEKRLATNSLRTFEIARDKARDLLQKTEQERVELVEDIKTRKEESFIREAVLKERERNIEIKLAELTELERTRRLPLDEEWAKVKREQQDISKERASLKEYEQLYLSQFNELEKDKSEIRSQKQESLEATEKSKEMQRESAKLLADAYKSRDKITEEIETQNKEYGEKVQEKGQLEKDIADLTEERRLLLIPLDQQRKALEVERSEVERAKTELDAREGSLDGFDSSLKDTKQALDVRDNTLKGQELLTQKYLENAQDRFQTAEKERQSAVELRKKTDKEVAKEYEILESKKSGFLTSCENKRVELERREKDLEEREIQVLALELIYKSPVKKNSNGKSSGTT